MTHSQNKYNIKTDFLGKNIVPSLSSDLLSSQGISGGRGDDRKHKSNRSYKQQPLLLDVPPENTHTHTYIPSSAMILPKIRVDKIFLSLLNHALPKFKVKSVWPDFRDEADWLKCAARQTLSYSVGQPTSILSHDPRNPLFLSPPTCNKLCLAEGPRQVYAER